MARPQRCLVTFLHRFPFFVLLLFCFLQVPKRMLPTASQNKTLDGSCVLFSVVVIAVLHWCVLFLFSVLIPMVLQALLHFPMDRKPFVCVNHCCV